MPSDHGWRPSGLAEARLNVLFGEVFEDAETYGKPPTDAWLAGLLFKDHVIVLAVDGPLSAGWLPTF